MKFKAKLLGTIALLMLGTGTVSAAPPDNASDVIEHLEFMGYEVSMNDERIRAVHNENINIMLKKFQGGILTVAYYGGSQYADDNRGAFLNLINTLNQKAVSARFYIDGDGDLAIESYYPGKYNRQGFSAFLKAFNLEQSNLSGELDELQRYLD